MTVLTTHDWTAFWCVALGSNPAKDRLHDECGYPEALLRTCMLMGEHAPVECNQEVNDEMLRAFNHLVKEHRMAPTPIKTYPRKLVGGYSKCVIWLMAHRVR